MSDRSPTINTAPGYLALVVLRSDLTPDERTVLGQLVVTLETGDDAVGASIRHIADRAGLGRPKVRRVLVALEARGLLSGAMESSRLLNRTAVATLARWQARRVTQRKPRPRKSAPMGLTSPGGSTQPRWLSGSSQPRWVQPAPAVGPASPGGGSSRPPLRAHNARAHCPSSDPSPDPSNTPPNPPSGGESELTYPDLETLVLNCVRTRGRGRGRGAQITPVEAQLLSGLVDRFGIDKCHEVLTRSCGGADRPVSLLATILDDKPRAGGYRQQPKANPIPMDDDRWNAQVDAEAEAAAAEAAGGAL